jgi:hypothetical protein
MLIVAVGFSGQAFGAQAPPPQAQLRSESSVPPTFNQGIASIPGGWVLSGTNSPFEGTDVLVRTDEHFNVRSINQAAIPARWRAQGYDHIGDIDVVGNVIYAPFEQPDYPKGHQVTARYDVATLAFRDAVVLPQHQNSFVAVDPATMIAYTMDEFDGDSLLRYDVANGWKSLAPLHLSLLLDHTQGASVRGGYVWISTSDPANDLFRVNETTGQVDNIGHQGHPGGEGEGIDATPLASGYLHAMITDPSLTKVWIGHFDLVSPPVAPAAPPGPAMGKPTGAQPSPPLRGGTLPATGGGGETGLLGLIALAAALVLKATATRRGRSQPNGPQLGSA